MAWRSYDYGYGGYGRPDRGIYRGPYRRGYGGWAAYEPQGTERYRWSYDRPLRRPPERSPSYGRGGDRAAREYARSHGYDAGYPILPRGGAWGSGYGAGLYDRGYRW